MARIVTIGLEGKTNKRGRAEALTKPGSRVDRRVQIGAKDWVHTKRWVRVVSSNVAGLMYDREEKSLYVEFKGNKKKGTAGSVYRYDNVPTVTAMSMFQATSMGRFVHNVLKKRGYAYQKVR